MKEVFLGIDFATQSARAVLFDRESKIHLRISQDLAPIQSGDDGRLTQNPASWLSAIDQLLIKSLSSAKEQFLSIEGMCISATSGTFIIADSAGKPIADAAMYNDGRGATPLARAAKIVEECGVGKYIFAHTPEFLIAHLTGTDLSQVATDWSHALKTGVDIKKGSWSEASQAQAQALGISLPSVLAPGTLVGKTLHGSVSIYSGMTDGCTAQISVGDTSVGSAVTTLGTTLVLKVVGNQEISGPGFYSHLLPADRWLAGAASNLGGISYQRYFDDINSWNLRAKAHGPASNVMYPLPGVGERFPVVDRDMQKVALRTSTSEVDEYRSILEGIAFAERLAYETLKTAGGENSGALYTVGGGSRSDIWSQIRATVLGKSILVVKNSGSDIGAAMIAASAKSNVEIGKGLDQFNSSITKEFEPLNEESEALKRSYQEFLSLVKPFQTCEIR